MSVTIHLKDDRWKKALRPYCKTIETACMSTLSLWERGGDSQGEGFVANKVRKKISPHPNPLPKGEGISISVVLADDAFIRELNKSYRGKDKPTNVLSFINDDEPLGDIILAFETIEREAIEQEKTFRDHTIHLIIHGILHLMGHDHENQKDATKMERKEIILLKKLGIANPYSE